ncbi:hypothetical protein [Bacillus sp. FJAT-45037]|nr:hypothetical protein [Bacillus sp. FJAT-45037]
MKQNTSNKKNQETRQAARQNEANTTGYTGDKKLAGPNRPAE